jgi:hypothetical protein
MSLMARKSETYAISGENSHSHEFRLIFGSLIRPHRANEEASSILELIFPNWYGLTGGCSAPISTNYSFNGDEMWYEIVYLRK